MVITEIMLNICEDGDITTIRWMNKIRVLRAIIYGESSSHINNAMNSPYGTCPVSKDAFAIFKRNLV